MSRMTFEEFMREVDRYLLLRYDLTSDDLDDWRYRQDYEEGVLPKTSASRAYRNARGFGH